MSSPVSLKFNFFILICIFVWPDWLFVRSKLASGLKNDLSMGKNYLQAWRGIYLHFTAVCSSRKPCWKIFASKTLNKHKKSIHSFALLYWFSHSGKNSNDRDHVWNRPIMHCEPLVIDYIMYSFVLFFWHTRGLHTRLPYYCSIWLHISIWRLFFINYYLFAPFPKNWPLKKFFRGHFGPQEKFLAETLLFTFNHVLFNWVLKSILIWSGFVSQKNYPESTPIHRLLLATCTIADCMMF